MTKNAHTGATPIQIAGQGYTLVYDWEALARIKSELGGDALKIIADGPDPRRLAEIIAIGLARHHPEMSAPAIIVASPTFVPAMNAVSQALNFAYWGPKGPTDEVPQENPPRGSALHRWLTTLSRLPSRLLSVPASRRPNSGG